MEKEKSVFNDEFVTSMLKNARSKGLPDDFESRLLHNIHNTYSHKKEIRGALKKSMVFFFIGVLSIGVYALVIILGKPFFTKTIVVVPTLFLFFSIIISLVCITNYRRMFYNSTS